MFVCTRPAGGSASRGGTAHVEASLGTAGRGVFELMPQYNVLTVCVCVCVCCARVWCASGDKAYRIVSEGVDAVLRTWCTGKKKIGILSCLSVDVGDGSACLLLRAYLRLYAEGASGSEILV